MIVPIRLFGDPVLRSRATEVVDFDKELRRLVEDLTDTMMEAPGAGLAAPQIGVGLRVFTWYVDDEVGHLVNPTLTLSEDTQDGPEGCLSIPGLVIDCRRALSVVAHGFDMHGEPLVVEGSEKLARAIQHETDHLDGVLFLDRLDREARRVAMKEIRESDWFAAEQPTIKLSPHATGGLPLGRPMRVVFAGTPEPALPALDAIADSRHELVGVVTRPDAPVGPGPQADAQPGRPARRRARRPGPQARPPPGPRVPGRAARPRPRLLPGRRLRRAAAAVRARHPASTAGSTCTSRACPRGAGPPRSSTRCGPATRSPVPRRSGSSGRSTPGRRSAS